MLSTDVESCWAGIKRNREVDYLACFNVRCACNTAFSEFGSQSLLGYLKEDKSGALIMLFRGSVYLALPCPLARVHFIIYRFD